MISELSILIPVFNVDVRPLVKSLCQQCEQLPLTFEILLFDDGSGEAAKALNRSLSSISEVRYRELPVNIGRSAIRNLLATEARFSYLLLLDNDCMPASTNFIAAYVEQAQEFEVVIGGITYATASPAKPNRLHWQYGQRAAKPASTRQLHPYQDVYLSNALVKRSVYQQIRLCESLKQYGHEDTLFALELKARQIAVKHIESPALHLGLETSAVFLLKTDQAVGNLVQLYVKGANIRSLKIVKAYTTLRRYHLLPLFSVLMRLGKGLLLANLGSAKPSLLLFDLYRLHLFCTKLKQSGTKENVPEGAKTVTDT
ncbi:glycosyltransferase family 2 protein [Pontibacter qinzhouensis]|uniref:Glycosyltransferase family 2 protein n=1 Tax=Pontibacter qinzhouensis TaxID=2603253 RepID=A0A5C8ICM6_9BACT|nr:glycosyltransferase [Pontibacter qinzhouensis]TXK18386.1 glycosyltransferase family 2 protein [Pontibacter qinzhouensis]